MTPLARIFITRPPVAWVDLTDEEILADLRWGVD